MLATPWIFLAVPGNFIMAALLTQQFGIDKATYGFIVALPAMANGLQIALVPLLSRHLTPKDLTLGLGWFNVGLWTMLTASLSFLPKDDAPGIATYFGIFFVLASLSQAFLSIGWTAWVRSWVPRKIQGHYFGSRNRWISLITLVFLAAAMLLFHLNEKALWPFQVLMGAAVLLRFSGLIWQQGIHASRETDGLLRDPWQKHLLVNLRAPGLLRFIFFSAWVSFWLAFVGPFIPVFSFEKLGVQPGLFSFLVLISTGAAMVGWVFWGRLADRYGSVPMLGLGLLLWEFQNIAWIFIGPDTTWMLYPMWIVGGLVSVSYFLCSFNLLLNLMPTGSRIAGSSLNLALTSLAAAVAPILAGSLLQHFLAITGNDIQVYRIGFAVKSIAILGAILFLRGMREPHRSAKDAAPGAFRTLRGILAGQGLGFLANYRPQREKR
jgi:MFS family permease